MNNISIIEVKEQRVITTAQLAEIYGTTDRRISENFRANERRYIAQKHFILLEGTTLKSFKNQYGNSVVAPTASKLYLWTEKGALHQAKSLNTDQAWRAYENLVDNYFNMQRIIQRNQPSYTIEDPIKRAEQWIREQKEKQQLETRNLMLEQEVAESRSKVTYYDEILSSMDAVNITQIAKDYGLSGLRLNKILNDEGVQYKQNNQWLLYSKYHARGYTKSQTHIDYSGKARMHTRWTQKGRLFIHGILTSKGIEALMDRPQAG